jgi:nicotinate-nucleotide--dimethylbenzimidazole phosphoribosyltransferase
MQTCTQGVVIGRGGTAGVVMSLYVPSEAAHRKRRGFYERPSRAKPRGMSQQPFDDIRTLLNDLPAAGEAAENSALGRLAPIAAWIAAWRGRPEVNRPILALYAGAHQGAAEGFDARAHLEAIASGGALAAKAAQHLGAGLDVFDLAIDRPVPSAASGPAMSERECAATMAFGMEALAKQPDLLLLAAFGPGAEESAEALLLALGEGGDPLERLRHLGGRESAALAGAILAARTQRTPVLLDGAPAVAAAAVLAAIDPAAVAHCRLAEPHPAADVIGLAVICERNLGLEAGAGALAVLPQVRLACALAS